MKECKVVMEDYRLEFKIKQWKHLFKLDPAKAISDQALERICSSGTDAIMVGGTDHVTLEGVEDLLERLKQFDVPTILEVSTKDAITLGFDYYFIPMVLNSQEKSWMMDVQHEAITEYKDLLHMTGLPLIAEGYCILNQDCKAFKKASCRLPTDKEVLAYAYMAEHLFRFPIFYLEYSGTFGNPDLVRRVKAELEHTILFYGGGIATKEQAMLMKQYADVVIVGNSLYTDLSQALETVKAVKSL